VFLKFRGGRAVASFLGSFLALAPAAVGACAVIFVAIVAATRYISLGSILGSALFPFAVWMILHPAWPEVAAAALCGTLVVWRHRDNIQRLRAGTEHVFTFGSRKP